MQREPAKGVAVMLYVENEASGTAFYEQYLKDLGFPRNRYPNANFYTDYHITFGYIRAVKKIDLEELKTYLATELGKKINLQTVHFQFAAFSLFGPSTERPFIAAFPLNWKDFSSFNTELDDALKGFLSGQYFLETQMKPGRYLPHMNLYGQVGKTLSVHQIPDVLYQLNKRLVEVNLPLPKLRIY